MTLRLLFRSLPRFWRRPLLRIHTRRPGHAFEAGLRLRGPARQRFISAAHDAAAGRCVLGWDPSRGRFLCSAEGLEVLRDVARRLSR